MFTNIRFSNLLAYVLQSSKKCTSNSIDPGQKGQNLSFLGILDLLYLPVSITKLCELKRNSVNKDCLYFRNRSALAVNCCVIIHCLEVSCKEDQTTELKFEVCCLYCLIVFILNHTTFPCKYYTLHRQSWNIEMLHRAKESILSRQLKIKCTADQSVRMRRLVCAFVVRMLQKSDFLAS